MFNCQYASIAFALCCGGRPRAASKLVMSQVYVSSVFMVDTYSASYVVLFNSGAQSVVLDGLSVQILNSSQQWQSLPISGTLQPGQSYLVEFAGNSGL